MSIKNYFFATFLGSGPSMFITIALGSRLKKRDEHETISFFLFLVCKNLFTNFRIFNNFSIGINYKNIFLKIKLIMQKNKIFLWILWLIFVIVWNYGYPDASPLLDVLVAVLLSLLNLILIKIIKKNE